MERKRIYITVKTYPTLSEKYDELVCTAGICEDHGLNRYSQDENPDRVLFIIKVFNFAVFA
jgi:hypothetical protein